jgi:hypothetical protein
MFGRSCVPAVDSSGDSVGVCGLEKGARGAGGEDTAGKVGFSLPSVKERL